MLYWTASEPQVLLTKSSKPPDHRSAQVNVVAQVPTTGTRRCRRGGHHAAVEHEAGVQEASARRVEPDRTHVVKDAVRRLQPQPDPPDALDRHVDVLAVACSQKTALKWFSIQPNDTQPWLVS